MKHIVILGGSYGGVSTAHQLLKQAGKAEPLKITLVTPNTHFYWNMASPRAAVSGNLADNELFQPIAAGFKQYGADRFEFVLGTAEHWDADAKQVAVSGPKGGRNIDYDILVLATGSKTRETTPFKNLETTAATQDALRKFQAQARNSKTIVVAGGGVTGVEIAGELAYEYGKQKKIILLSAGPTLVEGTPESVRKIATTESLALGVQIKYNKRVVGSAELPDGRQELSLSGGETLATDMYIPAFGLVRNSSYVPEKFLNSARAVVVDEYLKVKGTSSVWALGDVTDVENMQYMPCTNQATYVAKSIISVLKSKTPVVYKHFPMVGQGFQIGKKSGTGYFNGWKMPSFIIVYLRKNLFIDRLAPTVSGSMF